MPFLAAIYFLLAILLLPSFGVGQGGLLLRPMGEWAIPLWLLQMALGGGVCALLWLLNKRWSLLPGSGNQYLSLTLILLPMVGLDPPAGFFTALTAIGCTSLLFGLYTSRNRPFGALMLFSAIGWGSMVQTALLAYIPLFLLGLGLVKCFSLRTFLAALIGLAIPYWIVLGSGFASPDMVQASLPSPIWMGEIHSSSVLPLISLTLAGLGWLLLVLYNALTATSQGVQTRSRYTFLNLLGAYTLLLIFFDFGRAACYAPLLLTIFSLQVSRTTLLSRSPRRWLLPASTVLIFVILNVIQW